MNRTLRQLFTAVIVLFVILGISSSLIMVVRAHSLDIDSRNVRSLYKQYDAPRGSILAANGTVLAKSDPSDDSFAYQRSYANGPEYAPITGYFSVTQPADRGIEASENDLLTGESSAMFWQRLKALFTGQVNQGATIETSIDTDLQTVAYNLMTQQQEDGAAVAIEPNTGRILAMVSTPSYDPNQLASHNTGEASQAYSTLVNQQENPMLNRATDQLYPPGSTFKTVVMATALESGKYQLDTQVDAGGAYTLPNTVTQLTNATPAADGVNGKISLEDALAYSSNTAFAQLGVALGDGNIADMAKKLGFDKRIRIDPNMVAGSPMDAVASTFPTDVTPDKLALDSIGQGDVTATPLQMAMVASAIANDGKLMNPTLVDRVRYSDLSVMPDTKPTVYSQAFSADTANKLTQAMEAVVTKENQNLAIPGVKVAVKTGTAQIGENNSSIDGWVIGFAPADNPKIAVAVVVHNVDLYGSFAAGPIMKAMIEEALKEQ
ncbi:peptidoglycan D,D-transpeptidase FtsI family protein [Bifidobacterium magnum]|uniref:Penicillin-binding protein n=1 Tax=Bifidobacterium magnum TaxID=1692 RepID=A0A087BAM8_9BIFI|nr:penicillin-binding protein 2 [Bifidobacterium magnum]KFI68078.1 Penicillin-binding protein [Bifidobacterium magnum]